MKYIYIISLFFACANTAWAQTKTDTLAPKTPKPEVEKKGILRLQERSIEGSLNTAGWSVGYNTGEAHTYYKTDFWHFALGELKDPRETINPNNTNGGGGGGSQSRPFIYGKQNTFLMLQAGRCTKRQFSEKAEQRGVKVGYSYAYGASLGMLKPYYVEVLKAVSGSNTYVTESIKYTPETADKFLYGNIYGATGFTKGLDEIKFVPGGFGRIGLNFDWLTNDEETLVCLQTGLRADAYLSKIPIMANNDNRLLFLNLYATIQFGKRY
jgi:hypothetical protein